MSSVKPIGIKSCNSNSMVSSNSSNSKIYSGVNGASVSIGNKYLTIPEFVLWGVGCAAFEAVAIKSGTTILKELGLMKKCDNYKFNCLFTGIIGSKAIMFPFAYVLLGKEMLRNPLYKEK